PIDYERLKRAFGRANKAQKITVNLGTAHLGYPDPNSLLATGGQRITILDKSTGTFTLTILFQDGSTIQLDNTELSNGDILDWDFYALYITNTSQIGQSLKLIVDYRIITGIEGY
ncbi:MAG: hypothetical protein QXI36_02115, partial [Candidatus Bathyarchaeia archaeon]